MAKRNPEGRMPLMAHFAELRKRIFFIFWGLLAGAVAGWFLFDPVFGAMAEPVIRLAQEGKLAQLNFTTVVSAFDMRMRVAFFIAVFITSPWWLYQIWAFLAPGLRRTEKRYVVGFLVAAVPLFLAGTVLGWWLLPHAVTVFLSATPESGANLIDARTYLTFTMRLVGAFGIAFLFPVVMMTLNLLQVVKARTYLRGWRWAVVGIFTFAAIANPLPDPWSMIILGILMVGIYFLTVGLAALNDRRHSRKVNR